MLTLNDGRNELWQWDTGRTLAVDADCSQVHFSNKVFGRSIDVDVTDGVAIIPDILLQTDKDLNVWAFVGTAENGYTKISKTLKVNRRNKPADYVFTKTDQMTLQTIQRQIGDLSDLTTEAKDTIVAAINEAARTGGGGGGSTVELDTTLTKSGKAADAAAVGDAIRSLSEVKASLPLAEDGTINAGISGQYATSDGAGGFNWTDGPATLPNPNALTFTGSVTGSYDGSAPLEVEIPGGGGGASGDYIPIPSTASVGQTIVVKAVDENGKPTEWEAADMASGGGGWDLITDITLTEDGGGGSISKVTRNDKGEEFEYRQCMVCLSGTIIDGWPSGARQYIYLYENNDATGSNASQTLSRLAAGTGGTG